ncbi:MAG: ArsR/SmtB family transcription factor [Beijerinckiaceae bacterium]
MDTTSALASLDALSHETRLETFRLLMRAAPDGLAAGDIARKLEVVQNTMSAHLAVLTRAGLIEAQRAGRSIVYRASPGAIRELLLFLMEDCCQGDPEICAPLLEAVRCGPAGGSGCE